MNYRECWACGTWPCYPKAWQRGDPEVFSSWVCYACWPAIGRWGVGLARCYLARAIANDDLKGARMAGKIHVLKTPGKRPVLCERTGMAVTTADPMQGTCKDCARKLK